MVRWLDAPPPSPKRGAGGAGARAPSASIVNKEQSLDPRAWHEDYSFKVVERAYNASAAAASGAAGSSSSACLGGVRRGYASVCGTVCL